MADKPDKRFSIIAKHIAESTGLPENNPDVIAAAMRQMVDTTFGSEPLSGRPPIDCTAPKSQADVLKAEKTINPKPTRHSRGKQ